MTPTLSTFCSHWVITEGPLTVATLPQTWGIVTIMAWSTRNCHLNTLFLNLTAIGPITRGSKHLNLTTLIWHQSRGPMSVMIPKHSYEKGLKMSENQSQECYEECCKGTESTCHWIAFDVYGTFSIVDNVPEFRKSSSVNFIRIKDSRPSKAVVSRNALK